MTYPTFCYLIKITKPYASKHRNQWAHFGQQRTQKLTSKTGQKRLLFFKNILKIRFFLRCNKNYIIKNTKFNYSYMKKSSSENHSYMRIVRINLPNKKVLPFLLKKVLLLGKKVLIFLKKYI